MHVGLLLLLIFGGFAVYMGLLILIGAAWGGKAVAIFTGALLAAIVIVGVVATWGMPL